MAKTPNQYSRYYTYIRPVIQNPIVKSFAPYVFSLITIAVMLVFALKPTISTILDLQKTLDQNTQVLKQLEDKAKTLTEAKNNLDSLGAKTRAKIDTAIPPRPTVTSLIYSLQHLTPQGATVSALEVQPITIYDSSSANNPKTTLGEINFTYNIEGDFTQALTALNNFNKSQTILTITNLSLSKQSDKPLFVSISGKAYYLK